MASRSQETWVDSRQRRPLPHEQCKAFTAPSTLTPHGRLSLMPSKANPNAHFLRIPGELRNRIYRLALLKAKPISLTPAYKQPALLRTCKTTRREATSIYLEENRFNYEILSCKPIIPKKTSGYWLWKHRPTSPPVLEVKYSHPPDWENLMAWVNDWFHDEQSPALMPDEKRPWVGVVLSAFDMAARLKAKDMSWEEVEEMLKVYQTGVQAASEDLYQMWK